MAKAAEVLRVFAEVQRLFKLFLRSYSGADRGFLGEGLPDAFFELGEWGDVAGGAETGDLGLGEVLVAILEVTREGDELDPALPVNGHQGLGDCLEGAGVAGARVDDGLDGLFRGVWKQASEEQVDAGEIFDKDEVAALFAVCVAA